MTKSKQQKSHPTNSKQKDSSSTGAKTKSFPNLPNVENLISATFVQVERDVNELLHLCSTWREKERMGAETLQSSVTIYYEKKVTTYLKRFFAHRQALVKAEYEQTKITLASEGFEEKATCSHFVAKVDKATETESSSETKAEVSSTYLKIIGTHRLSEEQKNELRKSPTFFQKLKAAFKHLKKKKSHKKTPQTKKKHLQDDNVDSKSGEASQPATSSTGSATSTEAAAVFEELFTEHRKEKCKPEKTEALYTHPPGSLQEKSIDISKQKKSADKTKSQKPSSHSDSIEHEKPPLGTTSDFGLSGHTKLSPGESISGTESDIVNVEGSSEYQESEAEDSKTILERVKSALSGLRKRKSRKKTQQTDDVHTSSESEEEESYSESGSSVTSPSPSIAEGGKEECKSEESAALFTDASSKSFSKLTESLKKESAVKYLTTKIGSLSESEEPKESEDESVATTLRCQTLKKVGVSKGRVSALRRRREDQRSEGKKSKTFFQKVKSAFKGLSKKTKHKKTQQIGVKHLDEDTVGEKHKRDDSTTTSLEAKTPSEQIGTETCSVFVKPITDGGKEEYKSKKTEALPSEVYPKPFPKLTESIEEKSTVTDLIPKIESTYETTAQVEPLETHYKSKEPVDKPVVTTLRSQTEVREEEYKSEKTETRPKPISKLTETLEQESTATDLILKIESTCEITVQVEPLETLSESKEPVDKLVLTTLRSQIEDGKEEYKSEKTEEHSSDISPKPFSKSMESLAEKSTVTDLIPKIESTYETTEQIEPLETRSEYRKLVDKPVVTALRSQIKDGKEKYKSEKTETRPSEAYPKTFSKPIESLKEESTVTNLIPKTESSCKPTEQMGPLKIKSESKEHADKPVVTTLRSRTVVGKEEYKSEKTKTQPSEAYPKPFSKLTESLEVESTATDLIIKIESTYETTEQMEPLETQSESKEHVDKDIGTTSRRQTLKKASESAGRFSSSTVININEKQKPSEDQKSERNIYHAVYEKLKSAFKGIANPKLQQKTQQNGEKSLDKHRVDKSSECDVSKPSFQTGSRAKSPTPLAVSTKISYACVEQIMEGGKEKHKSVKTVTRLSDASPKPFSKLKESLGKESTDKDLITTRETTAQEEALGTHSKSEPVDKPVVATLSRETPKEAHPSRKKSLSVVASIIDRKEPHEDLKSEHRHFKSINKVESRTCKSEETKTLDEQTSEHLTIPRVEEPNDPSAVTTEPDLTSFRTESISKTDNEDLKSEKIPPGKVHSGEMEICQPSTALSAFTHTTSDLLLSKHETQNEEEIRPGIAYMRKMARCISSVDSSEFTHTACDLIVSKIQDLHLDSFDQRDNERKSNKTKPHSKNIQVKSSRVPPTHAQELNDISDATQLDLSSFYTGSVMEAENEELKTEQARAVVKSEVTATSSREHTDEKHIQIKLDVQKKLASIPLEHLADLKQSVITTIMGVFDFIAKNPTEYIPDSTNIDTITNTLITSVETIFEGLEMQSKSSTGGAAKYPLMAIPSESSSTKSCCSRCKDESVRLSFLFKKYWNIWFKKKNKVAPVQEQQSSQQRHPDTHAEENTLSVKFDVPH